jgi:hypothetical protein
MQKILTRVCAVGRERLAGYERGMLMPSRRAALCMSRCEEWWTTVAVLKASAGSDEMTGCAPACGVVWMRSGSRANSRSGGTSSVLTTSMAGSSAVASTRMLLFMQYLKNSYVVQQIAVDGIWYSTRAFRPMKKPPKPFSR